MKGTVSKGFLRESKTLSRSLKQKMKDTIISASSANPSVFLLLENYKKIEIHANKAKNQSSRPNKRPNEF